MYILFHFRTTIKIPSSDFQYSQCFDKHEMMAKLAEKVFLRYLPHVEPTGSYHFMV